MSDKAKCQRCQEDFVPESKRPRICKLCLRVDKIIAENRKRFLEQPEIVNLRAGIQTAVAAAYDRMFGK